MTILFAALAVLVLAAALARGVAQIQHTLTVNWSNGSTTLAQSVILTGQEEINIGILIPSSTTNKLLTGFAFTLANLQDIYILSDQDVTLKTNSTGSPQETLTIKANKPFGWYKDSGIPAPFAGNVTAVYATTGVLTADANLSTRGLVTIP
jgi:hypothetical protein